MRSKSIKEFNNFYYKTHCYKIAQDIVNNLPTNIDIILDVGCGDGALTIPLAKLLKNCRIIGVDSNKMALDVLKKKIKYLKINNIKVYNVNALSMSKKLKLKVSCVVSHWFLSCITQLKTLLKLIGELNAILKRNGVMFHYEIFPQPSNISQLLFREADCYILRAKWWDIDTLITVLKYGGFRKVKVHIVPVKLKISSQLSSRLFFLWENEYKKFPISFERSRTKKFFEKWHKEVNRVKDLEICNEYVLFAIK
jgi:ubiquinone/menaquinone biosynthesis C-methylase UbiE